MDWDILDIGLTIITILSFVYSYFSEEYRSIAVMLGFVLIILFLISKTYKTIEGIKEEQKRIGEKLKIHEQLINVRADI